MTRKNNEELANMSKQKILVNIGERRRAWLEAVVGLLPNGEMTECIKCALDQAAVEDPESYANRVKKWRVRSQIEEIERQEEDLRRRKETIVKALEDGAETQETKREEGHRTKKSEAN